MGGSFGSPAQLPDMDLREKTIIVTGANTGIGYETAKTLAQLGSKVILACRSEAKANQAIQRMRIEHVQEISSEKDAKVNIKVDELDVEFMTLDLGSLASTVTFAEEYKTKGYPLHVLICNAGMGWGPEVAALICFTEIRHASSRKCHTTQATTEAPASTSASNMTTSAGNMTTAVSNMTTSASNMTTSASNMTTVVSNMTTSASNMTTAVNNMTSTSTMTTHSSNVRRHTTTIVIGVIVVFAVIIAIIGATYCICKRRGTPFGYTRV